MTLAAVDAGGILASVSTVKEIEAAIQQLSPDDMAAFLALYAEFDPAAWDRQIAADDAAGRLVCWSKKPSMTWTPAAAPINEASSKPAFLAPLSGFAR